MFGLAEKWKKSRSDRLTRLVRSIEALSESDRKLIEQSSNVDRLRLQGALDLHRICRTFVDKVNEKLSEPSVLLDPPSFSEDGYSDTTPNLFQINLRGRLLQMEFGPTTELYENEDFRHPYVLRGAVRSFNQDLLENNSVDEQMIFYCPMHAGAHWYYFDGRTYRTGRVAESYLISEMERLI